MGDWEKVWTYPEAERKAFAISKLMFEGLEFDWTAGEFRRRS
jgi:hypothetical protein